jgi:hypothetical protein
MVLLIPNNNKEKNMIRTLSMLFLIIVLATACTVSASAQKKEGAKKETPALQQSMMKEVLSQYVGKATNLGTLKKVAGDYFVLEDEGSTMMHPLYTLHTIKLMKDSESGETRIEIRLIGKD